MEEEFWNYILCLGRFLKNAINSWLQLGIIRNVLYFCAFLSMSKRQWIFHKVNINLFVFYLFVNNSPVFYIHTRKMPYNIIDEFFHWRIKLTYHFEKKVNLGWHPPNASLPAGPPGHRYIKIRNFSMKNPVKKVN